MAIILFYKWYFCPKYPQQIWIFSFGYKTKSNQAYLGSSCNPKFARRPLTRKDFQPEIRISVKMSDSAAASFLFALSSLEFAASLRSPHQVSPVWPGEFHKVGKYFVNFKMANIFWYKSFFSDILWSRVTPNTGKVPGTARGQNVADVGQGHPITVPPVNRKK